MILVDTSILSLAFRRRSPSRPEPHPVQVFRRTLLEDTPLAIPGIVLQELLSGVRTDQQFKRLRSILEAFPILVAERQDHILAGQISNASRRRGLSASTVDCLIAALAVSRDGFLFTLDEDFTRLAPICGLKLFKPGTREG